MKHYVYAYLREDGVSPYYIGKGSGSRAYVRQKDDVAAPPKHRIFIIKDKMEEKDALELERLLILMWGRKIDGGILQNVSEGGTQPPNWKGRKRSAENRKRNSEASRRRWANPEYKARASAAMSAAHTRKVPCVVDGVAYPSQSAAARALGMSRQGIRYRLGI